ncbi:MAG TPA: prephenate dehydrogenase/arogenate dehydrogenase family protein [Anaerolineae bacterium]|nr:prephenate dehydrogenase/arogenate dehydrogenase family protein [Anaerolineae bacterium]HQH39182.1 prephenate dehydrogenase/arogenate dehydrogenase family protein [Anaerolineae bacterium]
MNRQRITIIGTGCIGTSIGLALRQSPDADHLEIVGHDRELGRARQAQKLGAFDRTDFNLDLALNGARLVILAVPLAEMRETLADVGRLLAPDDGVVITDTAPLKVPVIAWAEEALPPGNPFIGADPFLAPGAGGWEPLESLHDARTDLFSRAVYAITARPDDHPSATRAIANLALVLGAEPLYMDPAEHDAVRLIADAVPDVVATALFQATVGAPGWAEVRKAAGRPFATATAAATGDAASRRMFALLGRDTLLRGIDAVLARLHELREMIAQSDAETLENAFAATDQARAYWMAESHARTWEIERGALKQESLFQRTLQALLGETMTGKSPERTRPHEDRSGNMPR